ncbi:MAG TPA: response regulator [Bryobacteraceae bacterium]|nr:response regulator [Bryobacteraceae bacterium]
MKPTRVLLVVDDEPLILQSIQDLFEDEFEVLTSGNPEEALQTMQEREISVVLSDQRMAGLTGDQFLAKAKLVSAATRLLISGYSDMEGLSRAVNNGQIYAYIPKPWNPADLKRMVGTAVQHYTLTCAVERERVLVEALMNNIPDRIYFKDVESRFTRINRAQARYLGLQDPSESLGHTDSDYLDPEYARSTRADELSIVKTGEPLLDKMEESGKADGGTCWFSTSKVPMRSAGGEVTGIVGVSRDMTSVKRTEDALRSSDELFRQLANSIDEVFWISNADRSEILYISPEYEKLWGRTRESLYENAMSWGEAIHPDDRALVFEAMEPGASPYFNEEFRIFHTDGTLRWVLARTFPVGDKNGEIVRITGVAQDITERKRAQEMLSHAKLGAEAANRAKTHFLASMSHEIRTPMNAILGITELLAETELTALQREYVGLFQRAGATLLKLINDILDLSKVEAGRLELESCPFDLAALVRDAMEISASGARQKGLRLVDRIQPEVPATLVGDSGRLKQILVNLIGNAIKFTQAGQITIDVRAAAGFSEPGHWQFSVSDTGVGIPPDKQAMIFENFSQADSSTTRQFGGTGLGLAICRRLVTLMGGEIRVESQVGEGSTFIFTVHLPCAAGQEGKQLEIESDRATVNQGAKPRPIQASRVLLVDDSQDNLFLIRHYLKNSAYVLEEAENGEVAVRKFQRDKFDLVLMDVQMPVMDGYAATRAIRAWEREQQLERTPVLALTADGLQEDIRRSLDAGCTAHLLKPIQKNTLLDAIGTDWGSLPAMRAPASTAESEMPGPPAKNAPKRLQLHIPEGLEDLIPGYLNARRSDLQTLHAAMSQREFTSIAKLAHNLKGTGMGYGFPQITEIGRLLEKAAKESNEKEAAEQVQFLSSFLKDVEELQASGAF